jgi:hypothetical protein
MSGKTIRFSLIGRARLVSLRPKTSRMRTEGSVSIHLPLLRADSLKAVPSGPGWTTDLALRDFLPGKEKGSLTETTKPGKSRFGRGTDTVPSMSSRGKTPEEGIERLSSPGEERRLFRIRSLRREAPIAV